ncbi:hypothetical protein [Yellowstone lake mimivirus]|uniref:hypothetical protein n=1 Tax=Yellowstone lake mimivirus TaxID=1586712 RepID=UPI0006EB3EA7|nr:hypothetical protein AR680_gp014 [Yellowstone lake mimivirus]BAT21938.1 hypothetical protein [Yellowstone lake mimivirus]
MIKLACWKKIWKITMLPRQKKKRVMERKKTTNAIEVKIMKAKLKQEKSKHSLTRFDQ